MIVVVVEFLEHPTFLPDPKYRCELKKKVYVCVSVKAGKKLHGKKRKDRPCPQRYHGHAPRTRLKNVPGRWKK